MLKNLWRNFGNSDTEIPQIFVKCEYFLTVYFKNLIAYIGRFLPIEVKTLYANSYLRLENMRTKH